MTKALKKIDSHVGVVLYDVSHLRTTAVMHVTDSAEFLKLIKSLEDDEFILAKCPNYFDGKPDEKEIIIRYLLFIEGFGSLTWVYDHKKNGDSK